MASGDFVLEPRGPFTLASAARFVAGWAPAQAPAAADGQVRLAFLSDDFSGDARAAFEGRLDRAALLAPEPDERRVRARAAEHYDAPEVVDDDAAFAALAERWRPFRTWPTVLLRATG